MDGRGTCFLHAVCPHFLRFTAYPGAYAPHPRRKRPAPSDAGAQEAAASCAECGVGDGCHLIDCSVGVARAANDPGAAAALERGRRITSKLRELAGQAVPHE